MKIHKDCKVVDVNSVKTREGMNDVTVTMKSALKPDLVTISVTNKWVIVNEWDYLMNDLCKENNIEIEDGNVKKKKKPVKYVVRVLGYCNNTFCNSFFAFYYHGRIRKMYVSFKRKGCQCF